MSYKAKLFVVFLLCFFLGIGSYINNISAQISKKNKVQYKIELDDRIDIDTISNVGNLSDFDKLEAMKNDVSDLDWVQLTAKYKLEANRKSEEWAENVTFKWEVIIETPKGKPMRIIKEVTYYEIKLNERDCKTSLFLRPTFMESYFDGKNIVSTGSKIWARITCNVNGIEVNNKKNIIGNNSKKRTDKSFDASGSKFEVVINPDRALMTKDETPFAATQSKYFYNIKQNKTINK